MTCFRVLMYPAPIAHEARILRITASLIEHRIFGRVMVVAALRTPEGARRKKFS